VLTTDAQVNGSHATLGRAGTTYFNAAGAGLEAGDTATLGARTVALDLTVSAATTIDELRIVTYARPDHIDTVVSAERSGDLPFAGRVYGDVRTARALALLAQHRIAFPHTACLATATGEVTNAIWASNPSNGLPDMIEDLELAVGRELVGPAFVAGSASIVSEAYGVRASDIADALDYARDAENVLDGLVLAPASGCGPSILRPSAIAQRNLAPLQAAFARSGTGALEGASGTSWYTPSSAQLRNVGTVGAAQMLRRQLVSAAPTEPNAAAAANDTLALIDTEIGPSWTEWRVCEDSSCAGDPQFTARWSAFERTGTARPAGVPVLVASASDARCLLRGREPLAPAGATCAHVTASTTRYAPMTAISIGGAPAGSCSAFGPYCQRAFRIGNMRLATSEDRRFVLWCARESGDPAGACRSYELADVIFTGGGPQVHALGGAIGAMVAESFAVDPLDPAFPMFNSLGFSRDFVPPLENELTDDDDAREDSYRVYLASAERAQGEASTLLAAARQHELEQLAYDRTVEAQLASAALAQQETVSSLCGADTPEADCDVERIPRARLGATVDGVPGLALVLDPGPSETFSFPGGPYDCTNVAAAMATTSGAQKLIVLREVVKCAQWQMHAALAASEVRDVPSAVFDAVVATSISGVPSGDFGEVGGSVRQQYITLYQDFEDLRALVRTLEATVATAVLQIDQVRRTYVSTENGWFDGGFGCVLKYMATGVVAIAAVAAATLATGGTVGIAVAGALASGALSAGAVMDSCSDEDLQRRNLVDQAMAQTIGTVESLAGLGDQLRRLFGKVALADTTFDDIERQVELAATRRDIAERLATSGVEGDPTWRALMGVERRRADEALANAQRYAFVARRAIETRLAIDMPSMTDGEPYVQAPSFWVNDVFALHQAIDYVPVDGAVVAIDVRAEAVEDYVSGLSSFVDGYAFNRRFSEGEDVQIVNFGDIEPLPTSVPGITPGERPFVSSIVFQCKNASGPLPGGVPDGFVVVDPLDPPAPCGVFTTPTGTVDLGGVDHASFAFAIPVDLVHGYFGDRLAGGNYNYRIRDVALNLVGRALFDCENAARPMECYGDGNVQYSMRHEGETVLESWDHQQRRFAFEPGVITRARALADERWLTNPLSSTDTGLLAPYTRAEWHGRPLAGTYTIEIKGRDEMEWRHLENVQILLRYHYWTRQRP
jgi:hypothetical protein